MPIILATEKETVMVDLSEVPAVGTIVVRTYELHDIVWVRGSRWTGYDTRAEAQAVIDFAGQDGKVVTRTFEMSWDLADERDARLLDIARPGIAERVEVAR